jgi:hypothetical protein
VRHGPPGHAWLQTWTRATAREYVTEEQRWERLGAISMRPDTGSAFSHLEDRLGPANPLSDPPLRITLHGPSLIDADGELLDCLRYLHRSDMVDVLCTWGGRWPDTGIPEPPSASVEASALDIAVSTRRPRWWAGSGWSASTGLLRNWEHVRQRVRARGLGDASSARLLDAYAAAAVHLGRAGHLFVCHDRHLLGERDERFWNGVRIVDASEAIALAGVVLRAHDVVPVRESERMTGFSSRLSTLSGLEYLIQSVGIHDVRDVQISGAENGLHDRTVQLIYSRDAASTVVFGDQDFSTGIPAAHALSALILAAHSLFEAWAVMADAFLALGVAQTGRYPTPAIVRKLTAQDHPGVHAALTADRLLKLQHLLATLRHPLAHSGTVDTRSSGTLASPMRVSVGLSKRQDSALHAAAKVRDQTAAHWGAMGADREYDPWRLAHRLALEALGEVPALLDALANALGRQIRLTGTRPNILNYHDVLEARLLGGIGESRPLMSLDGLRAYPTVVSRSRDI